jgi:lactoylglutathione lyase
MILRYTILYVDDVPSTLRFYQEALGIQPRFLHESGDFAELETGATRLAFSSRALMRQLGKETATPDPRQPIFEIAFEADDVESALERARSAGAKITQEPRLEAWGQKTAYFSDPNGFLVEICTPVPQQ